MIFFFCLSPLARRALLIALSWIGISCPASAADYYVALHGSDDGLGNEVDPFATLARARDAIRSLKRAGPLDAPTTVYVRGGVHSLPEGLQLDKRDSGSALAPVVWRAYPDENPVLLGGRAITGFVAHQGEIVRADMAAQGLSDITFGQLIFRSQRQHLARYPNFDPQNPYGGGWAYAAGKFVSMYAEVPGEDKHSLVCQPQDTRDWSRPEEVEVFVFPRYNWWNNVCRIQSVDWQTRCITLATDASYPIRPGNRYYFQNALEELDAPGEWYLDKQARVLYFWPPAALTDGSVVVPTTRTILRVGTGAAHITFQGFTFECAAGNAVMLNNTTDCQIVSCTVRNVGDYDGSGVVIRGGTRNGVVGCDIYEVGRNAISIGGGDRRTLTPAENYADNNYLHHTGVFYKQGVGISLNGVSNRATHNLIHDCPRFGILFHGNNLAIEYNHIRHVNLETSDTGAVYTGGRDWLGSRGTVIRHNYFHDILGYGLENGHWVSPHYAWGIYLDDNAGGVDVMGNIVARANRGLIHLHNGRDNHIENNIFVDGELQQIECNGWTASHRLWTDHLQTMIKGYELVAKQPAWRAMRNMRLHPKNAVLPDGNIMSGNVFLRNIICYRQPKANYVAVRNFPFDHNQFDYNLIWHDGLTLRTGQTKHGKDLSVNLAPNPGFEAGKLGNLPDEWLWQIRPSRGTKARLVRKGADGSRRALLVNADFVKGKSRDNYPIVVSRLLKLPLGRSFRLSAKLKATHVNAKAKLMLQSYQAGEYFWMNSPNNCVVSPEWKEYQFTLKTPAIGEKGWHKKMKTFRIRFDFSDEKGAVWIDDVALYEVEEPNEWASWKSLGMDRHSLIADPLFVDRANDDYRLQSDSPAFQLNFQPIPIEKIGPYADPQRASWPIVEAVGAREKPLSPR